MLKQRTLTALVLAPLAIAMILLLPTAGFALVIAVISLQALWEWTRLAGVTSTAVRVAVIAANTALLGLLWLLRATPFAWYAIGAGVAWWLLSLLWLRPFRAFVSRPHGQSTGKVGNRNAVQRKGWAQRSTNMLAEWRTQRRRPR